MFSSIRCWYFWRGANMLEIAFIGTKGIPARYGGFETAVEQVSLSLVKKGHKCIVYCTGNKNKYNI